MSCILDELKFMDGEGITRVEICRNCQARKVTLVGEDGQRVLTLNNTWNVPTGINIEEVAPFWCSVCPEQHRFV